MRLWPVGTPSPNRFALVELTRNRKIGGAAVAAGIFLIGIGLWIFFQPSHTLRIQDLDNGRVILSEQASPQDNLWLVFINSVEGLPVADHYVLDHEHKLVFEETIYMAPYAGYLHEERAENVAPGTTRIAGYDREMETVTFFAGDTSRHMLFWNGHWVPLYGAAKGGDLIEISVERESRAGKWMKRILFHD